MKKLTLALLALCMVVAISFTSCKKGGGDPEPTKLKERIQSKCYGLGSVTKAGSNVTSDFTGAKICFGADATSGSLITGGSSSVTATTTFNVGDNTITVAGTNFPGTTGWASTLTSASSPEDGSALTFTVTITNPKTGAADYVFNLVKQ